MDQAVRENVDERQTPAPAPAEREPAAASRAMPARSLSSLMVQAKLTVGPASDPYEREADDVADRVTRALQAPAELRGGQNRPESRIRRAHNVGAADADLQHTQRIGDGGLASSIRDADADAAVRRKVAKSADDSQGPIAEIADAALGGDVLARSDATLKLVKAGTAKADHPYVKARIEANGGKEPGSVKKYKWGVPHRNGEGHLPGVPGAGGFTEYYINNLDDSNEPSLSATSAERLVVQDSGGTVFHTDTHYGRDGSPAFTHLE